MWLKAPIEERDEVMDRVGKHSEASISTSASASATSSREGTKWQGAAITGFPLTSYMGNAVCCAWNACHDVQRRG